MMDDMNYESPIQLFVEEASSQMSKSLNAIVMETVHNYNVQVDEEELRKALLYDRQQYEKGFADGQKSAVKHGHWIRVYRSNRYGEVYDEIICSRCEKTAHMTGDPGDWDLTDYCPECGAKMDEEVQE